MPRRAASNGFAELPPWNDDDGTLTVVIETPKGSRNKFAYDEQRGIFELKKVLPAGMAFPYDFGFVPSTLAGDGDPIDVLVLMDEPAFPGCVLRCRLIGVIEGEKIHHGEPVRNDRLIGIEVNTHSFASVKTLRDLDDSFLEELKAFFVNYHSVSPNEYRILGVRGPRVAADHVDETMRRKHQRSKRRGQSAA